MKRILSLVLTIVMLLSLVACGNSKEPAANPNNGTTPAPEVTTAPEETTPAPGGDVTPDIEINVPKASELIANLIGVVAATIEITKDSQFVVIIEQNGSYDSPVVETTMVEQPDSYMPVEQQEYNSEDIFEESGSKQVLFFDVAKATVNSDGQTIQASLELKVGEAVVEYSENVSVKDIVVTADDITSYYNISVSVNGDNVSVTVDDQNASVDLSEVIYGALANVMNVDGIEGVKEMLKTAAIAQKLEQNLLLILMQAFGAATEEIPTVSPEYIEHLVQLFNAVGQDIVSATTDAQGNTTYSLNLAALKGLLADIENKTLAEYLQSVYGENVVGALSDFLANLPNKTVKEIVTTVVEIAENANVNIKEVYALINLYVESVMGAEFDIEAQINERYNKTLAELLVEMNNVAADQQAQYIDSMKAGFANAADMIKTVSIDALLSAMFMPSASEGFIEKVKGAIDMLGEQFAYSFTLDANGNVVAMNCKFAGFEYSTKTETTADGEVTTVKADMNDGENDILDYEAVSVNGVVTKLDVVVRGYEVTHTQVETPMTEEEWNEYYGGLFGVGGTPGEGDFVVETRNPDGSSNDNYVTFDFDNVTVVTMPAFKVETVTTKTFVTLLTVEYEDLGTDGQVLNLTSNDTMIQIERQGNEVSAVVTVDGEPVASAVLTVTETTLSIRVNNKTEQIFQAGIEVIDNLTGEDYIYIEYQGLRSTIGYQVDENAKKVAIYDENGKTLASAEVIDNLTGADYIRVQYVDMVFNFGYEVTENGIQLSLSDEEKQAISAAFEAMVNENAFALNALLNLFGEEIFDAAVTFTTVDGELVLDIDFTPVPVINNSWTKVYIGFNGAIKFKVA